jgi:hypothetical protein
MARGPVRQPYAGVDFIPRSGIYEFGYRNLNCVQGRVVVDPSLEEEFAPTAEGHGEVEKFFFPLGGSFMFLGGGGGDFCR